MKGNNPINGIRIANNFGGYNALQNNIEQNNQEIYNQQNMDDEISGDN